MIKREDKFAPHVLGLIPINGLDERLQDQVLAQGELFGYKKKKTIFKAGARDPYTFYLLDGELELIADGTAPMRMVGGDNNANRAIAQLQPRKYTAKALTPVTMFRIERAVLDHILSDEQVLDEGGGGIVEVEELEDDDDDADWMTRLISSELFTRLPHENIQQFFAELEALEMNAGDVVVEQGTPGDFLYIVAEGKAAVTRRAPGASDELQLAMLKEGDTFGEEALISNSPRNASVTMLSGGFVMRLPKRSFERLVSNPTLKAVPYSEGCKLVEGGAQWLDVRFKDEHAANAIEGSINIPLNLMRLEAAKLDKSKSYVVYCDTGARSSTAAFLLARQGVEASYLAGGLARTPLAEDAAPAADAPPAAKQDDGGFEMVSGGGDQAEAAKPEASPAAKPTPAKPAPEAKAAADKQPPKAAQEQAAAAPAKAEVPSGARSEELASIRAELTNIKAERDKIAVKAKQAVDAAKELKRRHDEQLNVIEEEKSKREALESELAAAKADLERNAGMEQARLQSDLEHANKKIEEFQGERAQLEARIKSLEEEHKKTAAQIHQFESIRITEEVEFQNRLKTAHEELTSHKSRADKAELEIQELRVQLSGLKANADELASTQELQKADVERALKDAGTDLDAERAKIAAQQVELQNLKAGYEADAEKLKLERDALVREAKALKDRAEALDSREMGIEEHRGSLDAEMAKRQETLAKAEAALAEQKSNWKKQVEQAIVKERERMEAALAKYKQEAAEATRKLAQELAEQQVAEARAEFEAEAVEVRAKAQAEIDKVRGEFKDFASGASSQAESLVAKLRSEYETRLTEQEALLEDERARLETENVRLREALEGARAGSGAGFAPTALPPAATAPPSGPDLEIIEDSWQKPSEGPAKESASDIPVLEIDDDDNKLDVELEAGRGRSDDGSDTKERIVSPAQLADIRRKMQEKMKSVKRSA